MTEILRKSLKNHKAQFPKLNFSVAKNQCFISIAFWMLKVELKFEYTRLITKA